MTKFNYFSVPRKKNADAKLNKNLERENRELAKKITQMDQELAAEMKWPDDWISQEAKQQAYPERDKLIAIIKNLSELLK